MVEAHGWSELSGGDEFAGYRIENRLGRGGMGILYLAVEPGLERRVALKLIAPEAAADEVFAKRFAEESRIAASIEHPNVVPIYAAGEEAGVPFIAMRYVSGSDLGKRLARDGRLQPEHAARLIAQVGNGLDAIHAAGLVHRDVKPANVLLSGAEGEEHAYITDFGVARNVATESGLTQTGRFVGTLDYVAPEQISGGAVDARVDVYALGCLLFKLLAGEVPFPRDGEAARLYAHLHDPPPAPSLYAPEVPMALDDVVIRAMSKQPEDRYPSAGDLGRAAVAAVSGAAVGVPERTVATGAAATRDPRTQSPEPSTEVGDPPEPTPATNRLAPEAESPASGGRRRRPLVLAAGLLAAVAIVIAVIALGGSDGGEGGEEDAIATTAQNEETSPKPAQKPKPEPLTRSELIGQGDAICEKAQADYAAARERWPEAKDELSPNAPYSAQLVKNSTKAMERWRQLDAPASVEPAFREYVESQEEVVGWDEDALRAAEADDAAAYLEARDNRNDTEDNRTRMAEDVGFTVCSGSAL
ncbi:MAG TPA: serine/threonine-protein kinase [Solirubrobacterales bacterium]|nr:serine/threonine-protein kinase [Solirubrobacterales bacterium]